MTKKTKVFLIWLGYLFWVVYLIVMVAASLKADDNLNILFAVLTFLCGEAVLVIAHRKLLNK